MSMPVFTPDTAPATSPPSLITSVHSEGRPHMVQSESSIVRNVVGAPANGLTGAIAGARAAASALGGSAVVAAECVGAGFGISGVAGSTNDAAADSFGEEGAGGSLDAVQAATTKETAPS